MAEEIGLNLVFEERKTRGSGKIRCVVMVTEEGMGGDSATDYFGEASSWEAFKQEFPTLESILEECTTSEHWDASWRDNDRELFIESIEGHEGLYDYREEVRVHC